MRTPAFFPAIRKNQGYYLAETEPLLAKHARLLKAVELQEFLRLPVALGQHVQPAARAGRWAYLTCGCLCGTCGCLCGRRRRGR